METARCYTVGFYYTIITFSYASIIYVKSHVQSL